MVQVFAGGLLLLCFKISFHAPLQSWQGPRRQWTCSLDNVRQLVSAVSARLLGRFHSFCGSADM